jgi:hypothetical protein
MSESDNNCGKALEKILVEKQKKEEQKRNLVRSGTMQNQSSNQV